MSTHVPDFFLWCWKSRISCSLLKCVDGFNIYSLCPLVTGISQLFTCWQANFRPSSRLTYQTCSYHASIFKRKPFLKQKLNALKYQLAGASRIGYLFLLWEVSMYGSQGLVWMVSLSLMWPWGQCLQLETNVAPRSSLKVFEQASIFFFSSASWLTFLKISKSSGQSTEQLK